MEITPEAVRAAFAETGIDPDDTASVFCLFALEMVHAGWRNGPIEDVHADPKSPLTDGMMFRLNSFLCSVVLDLLFGWLEEIPSLTSVRVEQLDELLAAIFDALLDPELVLPTGFSMSETAGTQAGEVERRLADVFGATVELAKVYGVPTAVLMRAMSSPRYWWGGPEWPEIVDRFVTLLDNRNDPHWRRSWVREEPAEVRDRERLRRQLLERPWTLETETCQWLIEAGLGYVRLK